MSSWSEEVLVKAFASMELTERGFWPGFIQATHDNPNLIEGFPDYCFVNPECFDFLPFPVPRLSEEQIQGIDAQISSAIADMPFFVVYPMVTPILCCLLTGRPSRRYIVEYEKNIKASQDKYAELFEQSGMTPSKFLNTSEAKNIVNDLQCMYVELERERAKHNSKSTTAWPLYTSSYTVCKYYQMIINVLMGMGANTQGEMEKRFTECHNKLCNSIDGLIHEQLESGTDFAVKMHNLVEKFDREFEVYNTRVLPDGFEEFTVAYTGKIIGFMERCIMGMIGVLPELAEKLVHTVQRKIDAHSAEYYSDKVMYDQHMLANIRCNTSMWLWGTNTRIVGQSKGEHAMFAKRNHQIWMFNQFVRRVHAAQHRDAIKHHDFVARRVQTGRFDFVIENFHFY